MMRIRAFSDYHVHVRQGPMMKDVVPHTTFVCGRFLVMPNTNPPICTAADLADYRAQIQECIPDPSEVLMTVKLLETTTPEELLCCAMADCTAVKLYPAGVTTNSADGISRMALESVINESYGMGKPFLENLQAISETEMVLCIHGELPGEEVLDRETAMLPIVAKILAKFPRIRVVLEHITTKDAVDAVTRWSAQYPGRIAATITPHHLLYTLTDLLGDKLNPHLFCKPVLKQQRDRFALVEAATSGHPWFFLGSDSAPWVRAHKESDHGCAGVWNAPVLLPSLFEVFDTVDRLDMLEHFTSTFGDVFYRKEPVERFLTVEKQIWTVPREIHGIVPFRAGQLMRWRVQETS